VRVTRKLSTAVGISVVVVGLVAGCSSGSSNSSSSSSSSAGGAKSLAGTSFTVLGQWTGAEQAAFQKVLDGFDAKTGATATYTPAAGGDMATVLGAQVNGGTPPDVAILSLPGAISQYATAGKLQPVSSAGQTAVKQNFAGEWATLATVGGKLYGVPVDASNKSTVWYSANAFKNAGISGTPASWDDWMKDAGTLSDSGVTVPISVGGGDGWTLTDWFENVYLRTAGLDMYDKLTKHQIPWTDPSVITALNTLKQMWGNQQLIGSPANAAKTPFTASVDNVFKATPSSAIVYEASFVATTITGDNDPAKVGTDAKFFPFPSVNGSKPAVEAAGDFAVGFSANKAVQPFLEYLASPEASKLLVSATGSGFLSANKNLDTSAYPDATSADLAKQVVTVGSNFRFDMSDQAPAAFGGTKDTGEWADLQSFLQTGDVQGTATKLEQDAAAATGWPQ
jgi:ABC-type glycerol-3-phosphate transport system substrate-binding protein